MKKALFFMLLFFVQFLSFGQTLEVDPELDMENAGLEDFEEVIVYGDGSKGRIGSSAISLKKYCPVPGNQTGEKTGTKLGWAFGYGAMTILKAKHYNWTPSQIQKGAFSSHFLYEMMEKTPESCQIYNFSAKIRTVMVQKGNVNASYDKNKTSCSTIPPAFFQKQALQNKVDAIGTVFNRAKKTVLPNLVVYNTKMALSKRKPVVAIIQTDAGFVNFKGSVWQINEQKIKTSFIFQPIVLIGYDDKTRVFEVMNSLGKSWGNNGFAYISYEDFGKWANCGFEVSWKFDSNPNPPKPVHPKPKPINPIIVVGNGSLNEVNNMGDNNYSMKPINVKLKGEFYETDKIFEANGEERIQLSTSPIKGFNYMYILSVDSKSKVDIHFPKQGETSYIGDEKQVTFPRPRLIENKIGELELVPFGFQKDAQGDDFLIVLYTKKVLSSVKIEELQRNIEETPDKVKSAVLRTFKEDTVPYNSIKYNVNSLNFSIQSEKGFIAPLIIKIKGN
jgi:hypothetical protein